MRNKEYLNQEIEAEVAKKGFSVYNYISVKELLLTINKDYLEAISVLNIPLFIIFLVLGYGSLEYGDFSLLISATFLIYGLIFAYLLVKLFYRTYKFSQITNVIYTKKGLILGDKIFNYNDDEKLHNLLLKCEKLFDEYLSKPSRLSQNIAILENKLKNSFEEKFKTISKIKDRNSGVIMLILLFYSITTFAFYYIGVVLGFLFFSILAFFIKLYFKINRPIELKIKDSITLIDEKIVNMEKIYINIREKITIFRDGEISDLSKKIDKDMNIFYSNISFVLTQKDILKNHINNSNYKDFIDFTFLANYIKIEFNKPLYEVINLLDNYLNKVSSQINDIELYLYNNKNKENYQVEQKLINLQLLQKNILQYLNRLKNSIQ